MYYFDPRTTGVRIQAKFFYVVQISIRALLMSAMFSSYVVAIYCWISIHVSMLGTIYHFT